MIKLDYSKQIGKKFLISEKSKSFCVDVADITHISCEENVSTIYLVNEKNGLSTVRSLNEFEKEVEEYGGFLRVSQKVLINVKYFSGFRVVKRKKYIMVHDTEIAVSKRKSMLFKK